MDVVQVILSGLLLGGVYALFAGGLNVIFGVMWVINLGHGELMMLGAYLLLTVASGLSSNPVLALGGAAFLSVLVGVAVYVVLMRRMTGEAVLAAVLTTVALGILLRGMIVLIWSAQQQYPARALDLVNPSLAILPGARISALSLTLVLVTVASYAGLFLFLRFTRWGMRMRAAGQNPLLAAQRGINLHAVYALAWSLSTFTGAAAGVLLSLDSGLDSTMVTIGLKAFPAALVGGLDSLAGALVGSLVIAAAEVVLIQHVDPLLSDVVPFLILIAMLAVRPWGLFGTREELDRV